MDLPDNELKKTKKQAKQAGMERLLQSLNFLINREVDLRYTNNPRIALETILLKLSVLREYLSFDELIKKIEDIEKRLNKPILTDYNKNPTKKPLPDDGKRWSEFLPKDLSESSGEGRLPNPVKDIIDIFEGKIVGQD